MAKKPNTEKHECVEARDLIIAKRPRKRSVHLNDKLAQFLANTKALELGQDHEPRPLEDMTGDDLWPSSSQKRTGPMS